MRKVEHSRLGLLDLFFCLYFLNARTDRLMNQRIARVVVLWIIGSFLAVVSGCGDPGADRSKVEAKVSGIVKYQGKPVSEGEVTFNASNSERQVGGVSAKLGADGSYSLTTFAGSNAIRFSGPFIDKDRNLQYKKRVVNVKAGENPNVDFDLGAENDESKGPMYPSGKKGRASGR